ncbi:MAG: class I SAM-dependent DNA methyltransferase [Verrucomicrobiota bacterium]
MDASLFERFAAVEDAHWWFRGRRTIVAAALRRHLHAASPSLLEIGCGTGGSLGMLQTFGRLKACEMEPEARAHAARKSGLEVADGALPEAFPYPGEQFDGIIALDVYEHIEDDLAAFRVTGQHLASQGRLVLTVPALPAMWSQHDALNHHYRRYTREGLAGQLRKAGFEVLECSYFNSWLLPAAWVVRRLQRSRAENRPGIELSVPPAPLNALLTAIFRSEGPLVRAGVFPAGLSLLAVARRP